MAAVEHHGAELRTFPDAYLLAAQGRVLLASTGLDQPSWPTAK